MNIALSNCKGRYMDAVEEVLDKLRDYERQFESATDQQKRREHHMAYQEFTICSGGKRSEINYVH